MSYGRRSHRNYRRGRHSHLHLALRRLFREIQEARAKRERILAAMAETDAELL